MTNHSSDNSSPEKTRLQRVSLIPTKKPQLVRKTPNKSTKNPNKFITSIEDGYLVIKLPLYPTGARRTSGSGKSLICAETGGTRIARAETEDGQYAPIEIDGHALRVSAYAWISADAIPTPEQPIEELPLFQKGNNS